MDKLKVTTWNVEWLDKLFDGNLTSIKEKRINAIKREIFEINADVYCLLEAVQGEEKIKNFCEHTLEGKYLPVLSESGEYGILGRQWIWFLVKPELITSVQLLPNVAYDEFAGARWAVNYWGDFESTIHRHYRHPQVLVLNWKNTRIEMIGLHTKSKFVQGGESQWKAGGEKRNAFVKEAIKARIKMTTEVTNVRNYVDRKFEQVENPAILVMGDLNDGPGKEFFENQYLFFDLLSNLQGDVFSSHKFLNHALFDFPNDLRWTVHFQDFIDKTRSPKILLDHILFTQSLVNGSLPVQINAGAGKVEHEIHELVNAGIPKSSHTSDHKPVSVILDAH